MLFVLFVIGANALVFKIYSERSIYDSDFERSFGGPDYSSVENQSGAVFSSPVYPSEYSLSGSLKQSNAIVFADNAAAVGVSHPFSNVIPTRNGLMKYKVQEGDTLSEIAAKFGISLNTVRWANPDVKSIISPGQQLIILPISGIIYTVKEGDTLERVAVKYNVDPQLIKKYNPGVNGFFELPNKEIILPYAEPINERQYVNRYDKDLPALNNYFQLPAKGWNWGELHYYNAVDIAASCGDSVYAAAEGLVVKASSEDYWNDGYGNYILIEHSNGTQTRYAHNMENIVSRGDYVLKGEKIALIGNTGNTDGPTGCHLHFEVYRAKNPFAVE